MSQSDSSGSAARSTAPSATQHVRPEVAVGAGAPARRRAARRRRRGARAPPIRAARSRTGSRPPVRTPATPRMRRGAPPSAARPCAGALRGPPAARQRGGGHHPHHRIVAVEQCDERRPHRHAADEVLGAVDRIEHPAARARALLRRTPRRTPRRRRARRQRRADRLLDRAVGVGDRRQVGLGLHDQIGGTEAGAGDRVRGVGERQRQRQVVGIVTPARRARYRRVVAELRDQDAKVLRVVLRGGRLTSMPRPGRKRRIVLEHIVQRFEPGLRYSEAEVNAMLREISAPTSPRCAAISSTPTCSAGPMASTGVSAAWSTRDRARVASPWSRARPAADRGPRRTYRRSM